MQAPTSTTDLARITQDAAQGDPQAQATLAQWLLDGHGVERDAPRALHLFLQAAGQQHAMAANMAGRCLENGWGTAVDLPRATALYRQAAEAGLDVGMYNYANQLASGQAVAQDHRKALGWYSQAASQGHFKSMTKAGRYFEDGLVVPRDLGQAFSSYRQAAEGGDFRGQFCYAGMLAAQGKTEEALQWLRKVPATATPKYLAEAAAVLLESPQEAIRAIGQDYYSKAAKVASSRSP